MMLLKKVGRSVGTVSRMSFKLVGRLRQLGRYVGISNYSTPNMAINHTKPNVFPYLQDEEMQKDAVFKASPTQS